MKRRVRTLPKLFSPLSRRCEYGFRLRCSAAAVPGKFVLGIFALLCIAATAFAGSKYQVIYRFPNETTGYWPTDLITDAAGNLYGISSSGKPYSTSSSVYLLTRPGSAGGEWTWSLLHHLSFQAGSLVLDRAGNLYGLGFQEGQFGVVFELSRPSAPGGVWKETTIYRFSGWDGYQPSDLTIDESGTLFGTTVYGGRDCSGSGCGTVYTLTPPSGKGHNWKRTVLYFFKGVFGEGEGDGAGPLGITFDAGGNLFGITESGGDCNQHAGCGGTAFELKPPTKGHNGWTESVLYRFAPGSDQLISGVVLDKSGALYGVTVYSVYQIALQDGKWVENILTSGCYLYGGPVVDSSGSVYGTTLGCGKNNDGTVFKLAYIHGSWQQTLLHQFASGSDGEGPVSGVIFGSGGALYGTTLRGGNQQCKIPDGNVGCGTVFRVLP